MLCFLLPRTQIKICMGYYPDPGNIITTDTNTEYSQHVKFEDPDSGMDVHQRDAEPQSESY